MEVYLGMIGLFPYNFAPRGWAPCNGQLMSIAQNSALFSLLGTAYGGDGVTTFALPNLQGRTAVGVGQGPGLSPVQLGESGGSQSVTILPTQMPAHSHAINASATATNKAPAGLVPATTADSAAGAEVSAYGAPDGTVMAPNMCAPSGGSQPLGIQNPYLGLGWCIALEGIYPSRN